MKTHASQVEQVISQTPFALFGQFLLVAPMTALLLGTGIPTDTLYIWVACGSALLIHRYMNFRDFYRSGNQHDRQQTIRWGRKYLTNALFMGVWWSILFMEVFRHAPQAYCFVAVMAGLGLAGGAIVTLGSVFSIYCAFISPMLATLIASLCLQGTYINTMLAWILLLGSTYLLLAVYNYSRNHRLVLEQTERLQESEWEALQCLGKISEYRDARTDEHVNKVGYSSYVLAKAAGFSEEDARTLWLASQLHDVGKITMPDSILLKPGKLTDEEALVMQDHARVGAEILKGAKSGVMKVATVVALTHHEKWDGSGYPRGLSGEDIPIEGRIVAICDVYDALVSDRAYKDKWSTSEALDFLRKNANIQFDPKLIELFIQEIPRINAFLSHTDDGSVTAIHPIIQLQPA